LLCDTIILPRRAKDRYKLQKAAAETDYKTTRTYILLLFNYHLQVPIPMREHLVSVHDGSNRELYLGLAAGPSPPFTAERDYFRPLSAERIALRRF
jgi:hypothetical protein